MFFTRLVHASSDTDAHNSKTEGTGLGLAEVKKLVEAMGGTVGVDSNLGEGSCFWFEMPEDARISLEVGSMLSDKAFDSNEQARGTILYVEDNLPNIELVEMILNSQRPEIRLNTVMNGKTV